MKYADMDTFQTGVKIEESVWINVGLGNVFNSCLQNIGNMFCQIGF